MRLQPMLVAQVKKQRRRPGANDLRSIVERRFFGRDRRRAQSKCVEQQGESGEEARRDDRLQAHAGSGGCGARWWIRTTDPRRVKAVLYR